jgi:2-polyprenyl-3-methyl-5-hydroxy-6-metoxy-1,4-benzoquinol methylase
MDQGAGVIMPTESVPGIPEQRQFWEAWNANMRDPEHLNEWSMRRAEAILLLLRSLGLDRPRILDLGCGTGWLSAMLANFGSTTGIDLAESVIATAKVRSPNVTFLAGDILRMSLPSNHFDVVVSQEVIAHVEDQDAYLDRAVQVLRRVDILLSLPPISSLSSAEISPRNLPST